MFKKIPLNQFSKQFRINSSIYFHLNPVFKQVLVAHACNLRMLRQEDCNLQACLGDTIRHSQGPNPDLQHHSLRNDVISPYRGRGLENPWLPDERSRAPLTERKHLTSL